MSRRTISAVLIVALLAMDVAPVFAASISPEKSIAIAASDQQEFVGLPPFPEDEELRTDFDWSGVDWDSEVVLPGEHERFARELEESQRAQTPDLTPEPPRKVRLSSDEALSVFGVPPSVQERVHAYRSESESLSSGDRIKRKKQLFEELQALLSPETKSDQSEIIDESEQVVDFSKTKAPFVLTESVDPIQKDVSLSAEKTKQPVPDPQSLEEVLPEELAKKKIRAPQSFRPQSDVEVRVRALLSRLFEPSVAYAGASFIEYRAGIEKMPTEAILYEFSRRQNADGSFGSANIYETSAHMAFLLSDIRRTDNEQYVRLIAYLKNATLATIREKALQSRVLTGLSVSSQSLLDEIIAVQNPDGGFGLTDRHASDIITTLDVAVSLWAAGYSLQNALPKALFYITRQVRSDGSIALTSNSDPNYFLTSWTALQSLLCFRSLEIYKRDDGTVVKLKDTADALVAFLAGEVTEAGVLKRSTDTADLIFALRAFQMYDVEKEKQILLKNELQRRIIGNGTFDVPDFSAMTAARAFAQPDFEIVRITPPTPLRNSEQANLEIEIKNRGFLAGTRGTMHVFVDGVWLTTAKTPDEHIPPGGTSIVKVMIPNSESLTGDAEFLAYLEAPNDSDFESNWKKQVLPILPNAQGLPAIQLYTIVQKHDWGGDPSLNVRWHVKKDPLRQNYAILFREVGTTDWNGGGIDTLWNGAFIKGGIKEDGMYEVVAGAVYDNGTKVRHYPPVRVQLSGKPEKYLGALKATITENAAPIEGLTIFGYSASATSNDQGEAIDSDVPHVQTAAWVINSQYEKLISVTPIVANATTSVRVFAREKEDKTSPTISSLFFQWLFRGSMMKTTQTYTLVANGQDDTFLTEGEFYLWDPNKKSWSFLGSDDIESGSEAYIKWTVPEELSGKGYKIRAIMKDFKGNVSEPKESPEFEIINGVPPSGTVSVQGLTNAAWMLGEKKTISWNLTSPNKLSVIDGIYLMHGDRTEWMQGSTDPTVGSTSYTIRRNAYYEAKGARIRVYACDEFATCANITTEPFDIVDPSPPPPSPWGRETKPDLSLSGYPLARVIDAVFDPSESLREIVYREDDSTKEQTDGVYHRIMYRAFENGAWKDAVQIAEYRFKQGENVDKRFEDVQAIRAKNGDIHIVFQQAETQWEKIDSTEVFYVHVSNGVIASRTQLSNDDTNSSRARLAVMPSGAVIAMWIGGYKYSTREGMFTARYRVKNGSAWTDQAQLVNWPTNQITLAEKNGDPLLLVSARSEFYLTSYSMSQGKWSELLPVHRQVFSVEEGKKHIGDGVWAEMIRGLKAADAIDALFIRYSEEKENIAWLDSIETIAQLEQVLKSKNISDRLLSLVTQLWNATQFSFNAADVSLFPNTDGTHEIFLRQSSAASGWRPILRQVHFNANPVLPAVVPPPPRQKAKEQTDRLEIGANADIQSLRVIRGATGTFHVFFLKGNFVDQSFIVSPYYFAYDGSEVRYLSVVASPLRSVGDAITAVTERNDTLGYYFDGGRYMNTANYSPILGYRIRPLSPEHKGKADGFPVKLSWRFSGGAASSYAVFVGEKPDELTERASELVASEYILSNVAPSTVYYWRVVAEIGGQMVRSNIWKFTSAPPQPEIELEYSGKPLASGERIDFDTTTIGESRDVEISVGNSGNGDLSLRDIAVSAATPGSENEFALVSAPVSAITPKTNAKITVRFTPKSRGEKSTRLSFATNDADENSVVITLRATAAAPELDIEMNGVSVQSGAVVPLDPAVHAGGKQTYTVTIKNTGTSDLVLDDDSPAFSIVSGAADEISMVKNPAKTISPGASESAVIQFAPKRRGEKKATLTFVSNDADEKEFSLTLFMNSEEADALVLVNGAELLSGAKKNLGSAKAGSRIRFDTKIVNNGKIPLAITGPITIAAREGKPREEISILSSEASRFPRVLMSGESLAFLSEWTLASAGLHEAVITVPTSDSDGVYTATVTATAIKPDVRVLYGTASIEAGQTIDIGKQTGAENHDATFTLKNSGDDSLELLGKSAPITVEGDKGYWSVTRQPSSSIAAGAQESFTVRLNASRPGDTTATLVIPTSDSSAPLLRIPLKAFILLSNIDIASGGAPLVSGSTIDFGRVRTGTEAARTLTVTNTGTSDLLFNGVPRASIGGADAADVSISADLPASLSPGVSADLSVRFKPDAKGAKTATLSIRSNDYDDDTIEITLVGIGQKPEAHAFYKDTEIAAKSSFFLGDMIVGAPTDVTLLFKNSGDMPLAFGDVIAGARLSGEHSADAVLLENVVPEIAPGGTTKVTLRIIPKASGDRRVIVSLPTSDEDRPLYSTLFTYTAREPVLELMSSSGVVFSSDEAIALERTEIEIDRESTFSIRNAGTTDLRISRIAFEGNDAAQFRVIQAPANSIEPNTTSTLTVAFRSPRAGVRTAALVIESNDRTRERIAIPFFAEAFIRVGSGSGLTAEYFADAQLSGLVKRATDSKVDFDWQLNPPNDDLPKNDFSVRWSGTVEAPMSGEYEFMTAADDGARVWVNDTKIIDDWAEGGVRENSGRITLARGQKYPFSFEYFDGINTAVARLSWKRPDGVTEIIPTAQLYPTAAPDIVPREKGTGTGLTAEYFADTSATALVLRRKDPSVNFQWKDASPHADVPADGFSVRWYGYVEPRYSGEYTIITKTDDGVRLWLNGKKIIDDWNARATKENSATIALQAGEKYRITMSYYEESGLARAHLYWITPYGMREAIPQSQLYPTNVSDFEMPPPGNGTGLSGEYFTGVFDESIFSRIDPKIDFRWNYDAPDSRLPANNFSARWSGTLETRYTGLYEFAAKSDDGIRVTINGQKIIDDWSSAGLRTARGAATLEAGKKYDITVEHYDAGGYATARLYWKTPYGKIELVPQSQLYPQ